MINYEILNIYESISNLNIGELSEDKFKEISDFLYNDELDYGIIKSNLHQLNLLALSLNHKSDEGFNSKNMLTKVEESDNKEIYTRKEILKKLGICAKTFDNHVKKGMLLVKKPAGRVYVTKEDLDEYMNTYGKNNAA